MLQVIWVDLLTKAEYEAGFGSHTPMYTGQTQCVRYYMNFDRALGVLKGVLLSTGHAFDAHNVAGVSRHDSPPTVRLCCVSPFDMYSICAVHEVMH